MTMTIGLVQDGRYYSDAKPRLDVVKGKNSEVGINVVYFIQQIQIPCISTIFSWRSDSRTLEVPLLVVLLVVLPDADLLWRRHLA